MPDLPSDHERLSKLLEEGRITQSEFATLRSQVLTGDPDQEDEEPTAASSGDVVADEAKRRIHPMYWVALAVGGVAWFFGKDFGLLAWTGVVFSLVVLIRLRHRRGRWMVWVALALSVVYAFANAIEMGHLGSGADALQASPTTTLPEYPSDSFGITIDELKGLWNKAATERMNLAQLSVGKIFTEKRSGPHGLDDFWYSFDDGSRFGGLADSDGWVYSVGVTVAGEPHPITGDYFLKQVELLARTMHGAPRAPDEVLALLGLGDLENWRDGYWVTEDYRSWTWEVLMLDEGVAVSVYPQRSTLFP